MRVAALAVDPSSPKSGGAILGDRVRMGEHGSDPHVFIRSIAARGHLGGLALNIQASIDVLNAADFDIVLLETVGAGQSEIEVAQVADVTVVISAPGLGDDLQAIKAGILEVADILAVNKADLPGADATAQQLESMLSLRSARRRDTPVVSTVATHRRGRRRAGRCRLANGRGDHAGGTDRPGRAPGRRPPRQHGGRAGPRPTEGPAGAGAARPARTDPGRRGRSGGCRAPVAEGIVRTPYPMVAAADRPARRPNTAPLVRPVPPG